MSQYAKATSFGGSGLSSSLAEFEIYVGNSAGAADATDTAAQGQVKADATAGLNINAGAIVDADVNAAAAIAATKLADGTVSNTELQYINSLSSNAQTQLDAKLDDLASTTDNALVRTSGVAGEVLQDSGIVVDDTDNVSGMGTLSSGSVTTSGFIDKATAASLDIGGTNATTLNLGRSGQTTVIKGDLQVDGTTTTVNSTTLDVADANISVNVGGNQVSADDTAGLTVEMSDATNAIVVYDKDATSRWKLGEVGSEKEIADVSSVQTLTNKAMTRIANSFTRTVTTYVSAAPTLSATVDDVVLVTGNSTIYLPAAASNTGVEFTIKKSDSNATSTTVDPNAAETVDGVTNYVLTEQYESITVVCDGTEWWII